jgi:hypothetical protein
MKPTIWKACFNGETREGFCDGSDTATSWHSVGLVITLHDRITAREYVDKLGDHNPDVHYKRTLILLNIEYGRRDPSR